MLRSLLSEIVGAPDRLLDPCPSLTAFRGKCRVLVLFEGSADDRPEIQEQYLANQHDTLSSRQIALIRIAGGGVFESLDEPLELDADRIRGDLLGPSPEDFEAILVGLDGATKLRSKALLPVCDIVEMIDRLPTSTPW